MHTVARPRRFRLQFHLSTVVAFTLSCGAVLANIREYSAKIPNDLGHPLVWQHIKTCCFPCAIWTVEEWHIWSVPTPMINTLNLSIDIGFGLMIFAAIWIAAEILARRTRTVAK